MTEHIHPELRDAYLEANAEYEAAKQRVNLLWLAHKPDEARAAQVEVDRLEEESFWKWLTWVNAVAEWQPKKGA